MERKKRSKGRGWESCYVKKIYGTFGVEMRAYGQKLVKFCKHTHTHTHTRVSYSSIDSTNWLPQILDYLPYCIMWVLKRFNIHSLVYFTQASQLSIQFLAWGSSICHQTSSNTEEISSFLYILHIFVPQFCVNLRSKSKYFKRYVLRLYSAVSSCESDGPLKAHLFILTPTQLLWEAF